MIHLTYIVVFVMAAVAVASLLTYVFKHEMRKR